MTLSRLVRSRQLATNQSELDRVVACTRLLSLYYKKVLCLKPDYSFIRNYLPKTTMDDHNTGMNGFIYCDLLMLTCICKVPNQL